MSSIQKKFLFAVFLVALFLPRVAFAQSFLNSVTPGGPIVPEDCRTIRDDGTTVNPKTLPGCDIRDFLVMLLRLVQWFFLITGASAFLLFFYGGVLYVFSGGSSKQVDQGKGILVNTVIAVIIILGAYALVKYIEVGVFKAQIDQITPPTTSLPLVRK